MEWGSDKANVIGWGVSAVEFCLGPAETVHSGGGGGASWHSAHHLVGLLVILQWIIVWLFTKKFKAWRVSRKQPNDKSDDY